MSKKKTARRPAARKSKARVNGKSVWLVKDTAGDVLVFANKPTMQEPYVGATYKAWREKGGGEYLSSFCNVQFSERTGIAVPVKPVRVRLSVVR